MTLPHPSRHPRICGHWRSEQRWTAVVANTRASSPGNQIPAKRRDTKEITMIRNFGITLVAAILLALAAPSSSGAAPGTSSFGMTQIFSSATGDLQFIQLSELSGNDGEDRFGDLMISVTNRHGVTKVLPFPHNLRSALTAHKQVVIVSGTLAASLPPAFADYVMPNQFLPTDGGTINFAGVDLWTYAALLTVGSSLGRDGRTVNAMMQNFDGGSAPAGSGTDSIYEYYSASLDHYFMSGSQPDIDALDSGRIPGWSRTGQKFYAPTLPPALALPVCRYHLPIGPGSHFFSVSPDECAEVAERFPSFILETSNAFYSWLPGMATGDCPVLPEDAVSASLIPVYRLWNNRADSGHRYTLDLQVRAAMINSGWISEGYGPMGVALCVPSAAVF